MEKYYRASYTSSLDGQKYKDICITGAKKLSKGDIVLVKSNGGVVLTIVKEDLGNYNESFLTEREFVETVKGIKYFEILEKEEKLKELKANMRNKVKKLEEVAVFEMFAEKDKELKSMLEEYKKLSSEVK